MLSSDKLASILRTDESVSEFIHRHRREHVITGLQILDRFRIVRPGVVLEICGPTCSFKTEILMQICANKIISLYDNDVRALLNGKKAIQGSIVYLDCNIKFEPVRFFQLLQAKIDAWVKLCGHVPLTEIQKEHAMRYAFQNLSLARTETASEVLSTLLALRQRLRHGPTDSPGFRNKPILLVIDDIGSIFWCGRGVKSLEGESAAAASGRQPFQISEAIDGISSVLSELTLDGRMVVVASRLTKVYCNSASNLSHSGSSISHNNYTSNASPGFSTKSAVAPATPKTSTPPSLVSSSTASAQLQHREFMPLYWQRLVNFRLLLFPSGCLPLPCAPYSSSTHPTFLEKDGRLINSPEIDREISGEYHKNSSSVGQVRPCAGNDNYSYAPGYDTARAASDSVMAELQECPEHLTANSSLSNSCNQSGNTLGSYDKYGHPSISRTAHVMLWTTSGGVMEGS